MYTFSSDPCVEYIDVHPADTYRRTERLAVSIKPEPALKPAYIHTAYVVVTGDSYTWPA